MVRQAEAAITERRKKIEKKKKRLALVIYSDQAPLKLSLGQSKLKYLYIRNSLFYFLLKWQYISNILLKIKALQLCINSTIDQHNQGTSEESEEIKCHNGIIMNQKGVCRLRGLHDIPL